MSRGPEGRSGPIGCKRDPQKLQMVGNNAPASDPPCFCFPIFCKSWLSNLLFSGLGVRRDTSLMTRRVHRLRPCLTAESGKL